MFFEAAAARDGDQSGRLQHVWTGRLQHVL